MDTASTVSDLKNVSGNFASMAEILSKVDDKKKLLTLSTLRLNETQLESLVASKAITSAQATELLTTKASTASKIQNAGATNILSVSMTKLKAVMVAHPLLMTATYSPLVLSGVKCVSPYTS